MNAAVTFQIGLNESARAIRGKFTFAGAWESCCRMRTEVMSIHVLWQHQNLSHENYSNCMHFSTCIFWLNTVHGANESWWMIHLTSAIRIWVSQNTCITQTEDFRVVWYSSVIVAVYILVYPLDNKKYVAIWLIKPTKPFHEIHHILQI